MKHRNTAILALCAAALPTAAWADMGTPLMWAGMLHLFVGNAIIGVLEGCLLARIFRLRFGRTIGLLILANYFSAWAGYLLLHDAVSLGRPVDLNNVRLFFWALVVLSYLMTLVLELPFVALAFWRDPRWLRKSVRGSLIVQTVSYLLLFGWFGLASQTSLLTSTRSVPLSTIPLPEDVRIYFISSGDGEVYSMAFARPAKHREFALHSTNEDDRLFVRASSTDSNRWDLVARLETGDYRKPILTTVLEAVASEAVPDSHSSPTMPPQEVEGTPFNDGPVVKLGSATNSTWEFSAGSWAGEGLRGTQTNTGVRAGFSFETPFGAWAVRNATLLPGDKVLFQLGRDQICVFDPVGNRVALVVKGRGPVAIIPEEPVRGQR